MRIVVTGATGNVGTSVIRALIADPDVKSIVGLARRRPRWSPGKVIWVESDVASGSLEPLFEGADVVIHLAWAIQPSRDEEATERTNVRGSERVFAAVAATGVESLVYASSIGAYSTAGPGQPPVDESWPTGGIDTSFYSRHKSTVEAALDRFESAHPEIRVVRLRPGLIFKRTAASEIRRYFIGPLLPGTLLEPERLPAMPWIRGMRTQVVHTDDVAEAYRLAAMGDARGAFNIAAEPIIDARTLAEQLDVRVVPVPSGAVRPLAAASWKARLQPTPQGWLDMGVETPVMDVTRAHDELGWSARHSSGDALVELLAGLAEGAGEPTPPLDPKAGGRLRLGELLSGVGARN